MLIHICGRARHRYTHNCHVTTYTIPSNFSPRITDDFHSLSDVSWYAAAYLITTTSFQPTWGKLYQNFSVNSIFISVITTFLIGSVISGVAGNSVIFIIGRAIAGIGGGGIFSGSLTIVALIIPLHRRPAFIGALTGIFGVILQSPVIRLLILRFQVSLVRYSAVYLQIKPPGDGVSLLTSPLVFSRLSQSRYF
jgi:MFS family permease